MDESGQPRWHRWVILVGVVYLVVGLTFGALAGTSSNRMRVAWKLSAWLTSGIAFALVAWPLLTAVPAFVVALGAAALLNLRRHGV